MDGEDGALAHAEMRHRDGVIMIGTGEAARGSPGADLVVEDVDAHHARAVEAGAEVVCPPEATEFGTGRGRARAPEGLERSFGTYVPSTKPPDRRRGRRPSRGVGAAGPPRRPDRSEGFMAMASSGPIERSGTARTGARLRTEARTVLGHQPRRGSGPRSAASRTSGPSGRRPRKRRCAPRREDGPRRSGGARERPAADRRGRGTRPFGRLRRASPPGSRRPSRGAASGWGVPMPSEPGGHGGGRSRASRRRCRLERRSSAVGGRWRQGQGARPLRASRPGRP